MVNVDLFGNEIISDPILRDKFIEPPFSILDSKSSSWIKRKKQWRTLGIRSEIGRDSKTFGKFTPSKGKSDRFDDKSISIFDPALCEVLYKWFCVDSGQILDPFAGGSVRGIVANKLGYRYTGIDIRQEQINSNREQAMHILEINNQPNWYCGDSDELLDDLQNEFDFVFSCPPYANLEVYSDLEGDISNMPYNEFMQSYERIIKKACKLLKRNSFACFVVGEVRNKNGNYYGFVPDTIKAFEKCGMNYYNEAIFLDQLGTAAMRADGNMKTRKIVKVHQNILVFKKS